MPYMIAAKLGEYSQTELVLPEGQREEVSGKYVQIPSGCSLSPPPI
jgi:hypothetical protein